MNKYDEELVLLGRLVTELEIEGSFKAETILEYKRLIEENFVVTERTKTYVFQQLLNYLLAQRKVDALEPSLIAINEIDKSCNVQELLRVFTAIINCKGKSIENTSEEIKTLKTNAIANVYISVIVARQLLQIAVSQKYIEEIAQYTTKLKESLQKRESIGKEIEWSVSDVEF